MEVESTVIQLNEVDSLVSQTVESNVLYSSTEANIIQHISPTSVVQETIEIPVVSGYSQIIAGPGGNTGVDKHYVHAQSIPASTWEIQHTLNKRPAVIIVDSSGQVVEGEITYINDFYIVVSFAAGFSGTAYLN